MMFGLDLDGFALDSNESFSIGGLSSKGRSDVLVSEAVDQMAKAS